ncbi:MAG: hypothetical protein FK730_08535 [Asgard group archaeon]|nr:hypothetical protein [Asgard group archaeon]
MGDQYPIRAFYFLNQLYDSSITKSIIPSQLRKYFLPLSTLPVFFQKVQLIGEWCEAYYMSLLANLSIIDDIMFPVTVTNLRYYHYNFNRDFPDVKLTAKEAFLIFSNLIVNERCRYYNYTLHNSSYDSFEEIDDVTTMPLLIHEYYLKEFGDAYFQVIQYAHDYLYYLKDLLYSKLFSPYELAFYGAIPALTLFSHLLPVQKFFAQIVEEIKNPYILSRNRQIIYYCFLKSLKNNSKLGNIFDYNSKGFIRLKKEVHDEFPAKRYHR